MSTQESQERLRFEDRMAQLPEETQSYYTQLREVLLGYGKVKSRLSARCESFRCGRKLLAKFAIGGKTLKLYLAVDTDDPELQDGKYHQRNLEGTSAYADVPCMLSIRSQLAVRKATRVIERMMELNSLKRK